MANSPPLTKSQLKKLTCAKLKAPLFSPSDRKCRCHFRKSSRRSGSPRQEKKLSSSTASSKHSRHHSRRLNSKRKKTKRNTNFSTPRTKTNRNGSVLSPEPLATGGKRAPLRLPVGAPTPAAANHRPRHALDHKAGPGAAQCPG